MARSKEKVMDVVTAVFNGHVNGAFRKAKKAFIQFYGRDKWDKHIRPFDENGIMAIFDEDPNKYTEFYAHAVFCFANEKAGYQR